MGELIGTYVLVFFGVGAVHAAVLTGAQAGIWQVAVVWGVAVSLAIYATSALSGAHINPAITLAFVAFRKFPIRKAPLYIASQLIGAVLAAATLHALFGNILRGFEGAAGVVRGQPGSELSAMVYGEYFPNPALARSMGWTASRVTHAQAMLAEAIGTAFLAFFVFAVTESRNSRAPGKRLVPVFIGLTVAIIISVIAPLTQAGLNPARDFGPRLFSYFAGWQSVAIPGPRGGFFTVYILAPILGGLAGAAAYQYLVRPGLPIESFLTRERRRHEESAMKPTRLILVGGFLGAGKTTLLWEAGCGLAARGMKVGLITNDQAPNLVDTGLLARSGLAVREVAGSCFCCNFAGLINASQKLIDDIRPDVLIAEPVGSCTDLSATILQPLKEKFSRQFIVAPLSVLVDPVRLLEVFSGQAGALHPSAAYIFRKQLEEADILVLNKIDLLSRDALAELKALVGREFPDTEFRCISASKGEGVGEWLDAVLAGKASGRKIAEVDYDVYAEGEAVLGWLNSVIHLHAADENVDWRAFCRELLEALQRVFREKGAHVGHVKLLLSAAGGQYVGNLTRAQGDVSVRGELPGSPREVEMILNARVEMPPKELEEIAHRTLASVAGVAIGARITQLASLSPGRPNPTYRYRDVVCPGSGMSLQDGPAG